MKIILFQIYLLLIILTTNYASNHWRNHDISTLKLLQIVHRHGERAPAFPLPNDPFIDPKYWPYGLGQLTTKGKYRLYKMGEFIRNAYNDYLGDKYSPREVYARSSSVERCLESVGCLLAGAYPPRNHIWHWNMGLDAKLGKFWQPIGIQTIIPDTNDTVLAQTRPCPLIQQEQDKIYQRGFLIRFLEKNRKLYQNVSKIVGINITTIELAAYVFDTLEIEVNNNYYWNNTWTEKEELYIVGQLYYAMLKYFKYNFDSCIARRLGIGGLVRELNNNFLKVLNKTNDKKVYVYSTHDTSIATLMQALGIYNGLRPPFGATLLFELHENRDSDSKSYYFVKVFYQNETEVNTQLPFELNWRDCQNQKCCPIDRYFSFTKYLFYDSYDDECNGIISIPLNLSCNF